MSYNDVLRELREDSDLTQKQLAEQLNTSQSNYARYENGRRKLSIEDLITICLFYKVSADYVLGLPHDLAWPR